MVGRDQTSSPVSTLRASTRPTIPNSPPDTPVTINGPCFDGTISGAAEYEKPALKSSIFLRQATLPVFLSRATI